MSNQYLDVKEELKKFIIHLEDAEGNCCKFHIKAVCLMDAKKQAVRLKKEMGAKDYLVERKDWSY